MLCCSGRCHPTVFHDSWPVCAGTLQYDQALGIPADVWAGMSTPAQEAVRAAGTFRASLKASPFLMALGDLTAVGGEGVQVLRARDEKVDQDDFGLGLFKLPVLPQTVLVAAPKGIAALRRKTMY